MNPRPYTFGGRAFVIVPVPAAWLSGRVGSEVWALVILPTVRWGARVLVSPLGAETPTEDRSSPTRWAGFENSTALQLISSLPHPWESLVSVMFWRFCCACPSALWTIFSIWCWFCLILEEVNPLAIQRARDLKRRVIWDALDKRGQLWAISI